MAEKTKNRDIEVRGYIGNNRGVPRPNFMNVKTYRTNEMRKTYGTDGGDKRVVIKPINPRPVILKWQEKNINNTISDLRKRLRIS